MTSTPNDGLSLGFGVQPREGSAWGVREQAELGRQLCLEGREHGDGMRG